MSFIRKINIVNKTSQYGTICLFLRICFLMYSSSITTIYSERKFVRPYLSKYKIYLLVKESK